MIHLVFEGYRPVGHARVLTFGHAYGKTSTEVQLDVHRGATTMGLTDYKVVGIHNTRYDFETVYGPQPLDHVFVADPVDLARKRKSRWAWLIILLALIGFVAPPAWVAAVCALVKWRRVRNEYNTLMADRCA